MLLTLVLWALMAVVAYAVGIGLVPPGTFARVGDRIMAALWVGFVVVSNVWLALALVMPLTFWRTLGLTALGVAGLWLYRRRRTPEWTWLPKVDFAAVPPLLWFIGALGLAGLALLAARPVANFDTGLYHYQAVKWLNGYGVTPGIALLQVQLGYMSTWYAFIAPFDTVWWYNRLGSSGGFLLALLWLQGWLSILRMQCNKAEISDWFILLSGLLVIPILVHTTIYIASLSSDTPSTVLTFVTTWALMKFENMVKSSTKPYSTNTFIPLILATGAFGCKLSSAPVAIVLALWVLWQVGYTVEQYLCLLGVILITLLPVTISRAIVSGYPFFPSDIGGLAVEWACDRQNMEQTRLLIRSFARWSTDIRPEDFEYIKYSNNWLDASWLPRWCKAEVMLVSYLGFSLISSMSLLKSLNSSRLIFWINCIAWTGIVFTLVNAPALRFGIGYFMLLPILKIAQLLAESQTKKAAYLLISFSGLGVASMILRSFLFQIPVNRMAIALSIIIFILILLLLLIESNKKYLLKNLYLSFRSVMLLSLTMIIIATSAVFLCANQVLKPIRMILEPTPMPTPRVIAYSINNVNFHQPVPVGKEKTGIEGLEKLCWGHPPPCVDSHDLIDQRIILRNPKLGIAGGFRRLK